MSPRIGIAGRIKRGIALVLAATYIYLVGVYVLLAISGAEAARPLMERIAACLVGPVFAFLIASPFSAGIGALLGPLLSHLAEELGTFMGTVSGFLVGVAAGAVFMLLFTGALTTRASFSLSGPLFTLSLLLWAGAVSGAYTYRWSKRHPSTDAA